MKIIKAQKSKNGKSICTVELEDGEFLKSYFLNHYYITGLPHSSIIQGVHFVCAKKVDWCVVKQDWEVEE